MSSVDCPICGSPFVAPVVWKHATQAHDEEEVRDAMLDALRTLADELNRTPTHQDVKDSAGLPDNSAYVDWFGSFEAALRAADLEVSRTRDGHS